jgi:hypothetical protein
VSRLIAASAGRTGCWVGPYSQVGRYRRQPAAPGLALVSNRIAPIPNTMTNDRVVFIDRLRSKNLDQKEGGYSEHATWSPPTHSSPLSLVARSSHSPPPGQSVAIAISAAQPANGRPRRARKPLSPCWPSGLRPGPDRAKAHSTGPAWRRQHVAVAGTDLGRDEAELPAPDGASLALAGGLRA